MVPKLGVVRYRERAVGINAPVERNVAVGIL
jgi:hypothetical protein